MRYSRCRLGLERSAAAFTLIEVVVGLVLMAGVLVSSLLSFSAHRKQLHLADARIAAVAIADELLETLSSRPDGLPTAARGRIAGRSKWMWQTRVVGGTSLMRTPMQVIRLEIIEFSSDGSSRTLVSVNVMEAVQ